ncbi:hypothetical protein QUF74_07865 [Candidatus Halobeggiatoa sp. HSG11]|nr:hypothetical protein [Candidatus Halobeggiatoa sp. HSG11]
MNVHIIPFISQRTTLVTSLLIALLVTRATFANQPSNEFESRLKLGECVCGIILEQAQNRKYDYGNRLTNHWNKMYPDNNEIDLVELLVKLPKDETKFPENIKIAAANLSIIDIKNNPERGPSSTRSYLINKCAPQRGSFRTWLEYVLPLPLRQESGDKCDRSQGRCPKW